ncbi:MAG: hypothetical protein JXB49_37320 [Bacteroidales bacterium]|nr:hypothetical protein [Bacteroidales bacterium]
MKKLLIPLILMIPTFIFGQKDIIELFEPSLIKADIDTLISKMKEYHPTYIDFYEKNNIQNKIDSIKKTINDPMSALDLFRIMQPIISIDGHTTFTYNGEVYPKLDSPFLPFKVVIYNGILYIKENLSDNIILSKGSVIE